MGATLFARKRPPLPPFHYQETLLLGPRRLLYTNILAGVCVVCITVHSTGDRSVGQTDARRHRE